MAPSVRADMESRIPRETTVQSSEGRATTSSSRARLTMAAVLRLTRALSRVSDRPAVCAAALEHIVRAVPCRLATFAVPLEDGHLRIAATRGYPLELVQGVRIAPGEAIIGQVYRYRTAMCVGDIGALWGPERLRPRYRTPSFVAVPVSAGATVLGVVCLADRHDDGPFTPRDVSMVRALAGSTALALSREAAREQANTYARAAAIDPLSGLFNRRYLRERLEEELQRAQRHGSPVGFLMLDIDDFKRVNDRFGHAAGDAVIGAVADILKRSVRKFDVCARFGGEEFAVVMPGSTAGSTASIAERIRQRIERHRLDLPELTDLRVTASIGLSVSGSSSAEELVQRADDALYRAKHAGKNRVIGAETSGDAPLAAP